MTLDEARQMYEDAMEKRLQDGLRTRPTYSANTAGAKLFRSTLAGMNIDEAQAIKQASLDRHNNR